MCLNCYNRNTLVINTPQWPHKMRYAEGASNGSQIYSKWIIFGLHKSRIPAKDQTRLDNWIKRDSLRNTNLQNPLQTQMFLELKKRRSWGCSRKESSHTVRNVLGYKGNLFEKPTSIFPTRDEMCPESEGKRKHLGIHIARIPHSRHVSAAQNPTTCFTNI